ncbi:integrase [Thermocatellispora tengchongensis]|uniref:Integrase n=1 Tax=Thermocatellispora tengchongensis TaxID=1073253 RepID=A0A840NWE9_9ACTN|nr:site-specific integrase [Thermocatellispora tengchongensis]MBB5130506.1 integrase [Thermocatellispora tengchongensis]
MPSGKYQATVRMPNGKRRTKTSRLKSVVKKWATEQEAKFEAGSRIDPRAGEITISKWREKVRAVSGLEASTLAKTDSLWETHCAQAWGAWPLNAVTRTDAKAWVQQLRQTRRARHQGRAVRASDKDVPTLSAATVHAAVHVMSALYAAAMDEDPPVVGANPFARLDLPPLDLGVVEFYEREEAEALYSALERLYGLQWRTLVELGMQVGLRPGETYGLHVGRVDRHRRLVHVTHVMTRAGLREYPKSKKSRRSVPIPPALLDAIEELTAGRTVGACTCPRVLPTGERQPGRGPCPGLMFPAEKGGPIDDGNFRDRFWYPAVDAARTCGKPPAEGHDFPAGECAGVCADPAHQIRRFPPKIMRHTAASWLVMDGVPLYDVQHLLGHESFATTQRYAHLAPDAHGKILESWSRRETREASSQV